MLRLTRRDGNRDAWLRDGGQAPDPTATASVVTAELTVAHFYSKTPALAQREYSEAVEESPSPAKFRMTSDNLMNPLNPRSANELHQLALATDRLRTSLEMVAARLRAQKKPAP